MISPYNFRRLEKKWEGFLGPSADARDGIPEYYQREYGQDAMRMYVLFSGKLPGNSERDEACAEGILRYLRRYWRIAEEILERSNESESADETEAGDNFDACSVKKLPGEARELIYTVNERVSRSKWNTAAASMMEGLNLLRKEERGRGLMNPVEELLFMKNYILLSAPFTPYIAQELWERYGGCGYHRGVPDILEDEDRRSVMEEPWPIAGDADRSGDPVRLPVCIDGRKRTEIPALFGWTREQAERAAAAALGSRMPSDVRRIVYVPGRILNLVTK
ncbi:class I tRNA ligase family protein [Bilifractor sp. LCP21S3_A7]|uniref:class I tRNA ligase family protein n=1 Tax=Bilifractor sp. LCP21S3_A7 TaxID=3438738 RepID=UPI003F8DF26C